MAPFHRHPTKAFPFRSLVALALLGSTTILPPAAHAYVIRGTGTAALLGHDLTDPEDNGDPDTNLNYNATFASSEEPGFGGGQFAFNVFDNRADGGFNDKWCCGDFNNFPTNPISIDATFASPIVLRHFTLTSGEDAPERDPRVWEIQGSNDGVTFTTIFARNNPATAVWTDRAQVVEFTAGARGDYAVPAAYTTIRFITTATGTTSGARFQLSEIEYFATPPESLVVTTVADENSSTSDPSVGTGTSLREALIYAATLTGPRTITFSNHTAGGAVNFYDGTAHTITTTSSELPHLASNVTIAGPGAKLLTISGNHLGNSVFTVDAGKTVTLSGLTIQDGSSVLGGGIYDNGGTLTLQACTVSGNSSIGYGGGIDNRGTLTIQNSTITGNLTGGDGGGIFNENTATLTILNSLVGGNRVSNDGRNGGGIYNSASATLTVRNSTIAGNSTASGPGGGIYSSGSVAVQNSTITGNAAGGDKSGGGISSPSTVSLVLDNSIIAGNTSGAGNPDISASGGAPKIASNGYNFIGNTTGISGGVQPGDKTFANTSTALAQLLETAAGVPVLKDNGGSTFTVKLVPASPALDAGDPNLNPNTFTPPLTFDQRGLGFARIVKGKSASASARVDIGAFEVQIITFAPGVAADGVALEASDGPLDLTGATIGAMPAGGTFSGPGVDANGVFHPEQLSPGTYTITYTTTTPDAYGNTGSASFTITVAATKPYVRVIASTGPNGSGIDVPGEPPGTKFTQLGLASIYTQSVGPTTVIPQFGARVRIQPAGGAEVPAIYSGFLESDVFSNSGQSGPSGGVVLRGGDAAPGNAGPLGAFVSFREPVFSANTVAFGATIAGAGVTKANDTGLWRFFFSAFALVAGEGGTAPDAAGHPMSGVSFDQIQSYAVAAGEQAVTFVATLKGPGVKPTNKTGVWQHTPTATRLIFRTGDTFTLGSGPSVVKTLKLFIPAKTIPGQRRSYTGENQRVMAFATFAGGHQALVGYLDDGMQRFNYLALENTNVGHPGLPSLNSDGSFAMRAGLSIGAAYTQRPGKVTAKDDQVILIGRNQGNLFILCQEGSPVSTNDPEVFTAFEEPAYNDHSHTAFLAKVTAPGLAANQKQVVIYDGLFQFGFQPGVIARTGTPAAGLSGSELWKAFTALALPDSDYGPVFLATLTGPGVTAKNGIGLWATEADGTVRLLLRTGGTVFVNGGSKTVSLITTLGAALDSPGQGRYVDLEGNVGATLTFTDGTTALVHLGLPTPVR